jgi:hypothetical protein
MPKIDKKFKIYFLLKLTFLSLLLSLFCKFSEDPKLSLSLPLNFFVGANFSSTDSWSPLFEGVTSNTYSIVLRAKPNFTTNINIEFDSSQLILNDSTISPLLVSFTPENWNTPQTISVRARFDGVREGRHISKINHTVSDVLPFSFLYRPLLFKTIDATIDDNEGSKLTSSFQSGTVTLGVTNPLTISLTQVVNPSKSFVFCNFRISNSSSNRAATCQLSTNGNSVIIQAGTASSNTVVNWYVVEFSIGALVERGSVNLPASNTTITLNNQMDLNRSFIISYARISLGSSNNDEARLVRSRFINSNTIEFNREDNSSSPDIEWQVIQLDGARVQSGLSTISNNSTTVDSTLSLINLDNSFVIYTIQGENNLDGIEKDYYVRPILPDSRTIRFSRLGNSRNIDISWFAIEMVDGTPVQKGEVTVSQTSSTANATINSVDTGKTMILAYNQIETGNSDNATQDSGTFSAIFLNSTNIQFERAIAENNESIISFFTIQFQ